MAGWHSCSSGSSPIIAPIPGIAPAFSGVADSYTRSDEVYNGAPTWRGVSNGYIAYMCGGSWAGRWMFVESENVAERAECQGIMVLKPSGQWQIWSGNVQRMYWIDAAPSILCGTSLPAALPLACRTVL